MWQIILFAICLVILWIVVSKLTKKKASANDTYICDVCGERDCICHKEEKM